MIEIRIVNGVEDPARSLVRWDIEVVIPGLLKTVVPIHAALPADSQPHLLNEAMAWAKGEAMAAAKREAGALLGMQEPVSVLNAMRQDDAIFQAKEAMAEQVRGVGRQLEALTRRLDEIEKAKAEAKERKRRADAGIPRKQRPAGNLALVATEEPESPTDDAAIILGERPDPEPEPQTDAPAAAVCEAENPSAQDAPGCTEEAPDEPSLSPEPKTEPSRNERVFQRLPEHERIVRELMTERFGESWASVPAYVQVAREFVVEALQTSMIVFDERGNLHPGFRMAFALHAKGVP